MRVTFPHMGNTAIAVKGLVEKLGLEAVIPPPCSKRTLNIGTQHAPEFACLPLKINIGNFIEAYEQGADTVLMAGGCGPCRFGYYGQVEREILHDLGYNYEFIILEPPDKHFRELVQRVRKLAAGKTWLDLIRAACFAWAKAIAVDEAEMAAQELRPLAAEPEAVERVYQQALADIDAARDQSQIERATARARDGYRALRLARNQPLLRVGLVGEIYTILEPFANQRIEIILGRLGVAVHRSVYLTQWVNDHLLKGILRLPNSSHGLTAAAPPYLNHFVGGHGRETVGGAVNCARQGFDGVIQVAPLTCMPEIVAQSILPRVSRQEQIPVVTLYFDEHSGEAGLTTRLEAFVDLLEFRRRRKERTGK